MNLTHKIQRIKFALQNNVTLDEAEKKTKYIEFKKEVGRTIRKQADIIANNRAIVSEVMLSLSKVDRESVTILDKVWQGFLDIMSVGLFEDFLVWAGERGGQAALIRMDINETFDLRNQAVIQALNDRGLEASALYDRTTKNQIINIINEGRMSELTNFEVSQIIHERFIDIGKNRAEMIAFNEMANAVNMVEYETFKRNQVTRVRWVTVMDERVCPICEPLHNQEVSINGKFTAGEGKALFNGIRPPAHVGCRCYLEEVIDEFSVQNERIIWTGK